MEQKHVLWFMPLLILYFFFLVLSHSIWMAEENNSPLYRSTFFNSWHFSLFLWCTIHVIYLCVATSKNELQFNWDGFPFLLPLIKMELCTLFTFFVFYFNILSCVYTGSPIIDTCWSDWSKVQIVKKSVFHSELDQDTVLKCTVIENVIKSRLRCLVLNLFSCHLSNVF